MKVKDLERLHYLETKIYNWEELSEQETKDFEKLFNFHIQELLRGTR